MFWTFLALDGLMADNKVQADEYLTSLDELLVTMDDETKCLPELYSVPQQSVSLFLLIS